MYWLCIVLARDAHNSETTHRKIRVAWQKMILPPRFIAPQSLSQRSWFTLYLKNRDRSSIWIMFDGLLEKKVVISDHFTCCIWLQYFSQPISLNFISMSSFHLLLYLQNGRLPRDLTTNTTSAHLVPFKSIQRRVRTCRSVYVSSAHIYSRVLYLCTSQPVYNGILSVGYFESDANRSVSSEMAIGCIGLGFLLEHL
jgi:hypothetical protein